MASQESSPKKRYARYAYIRGFRTLWKGDPNQAGALFRSIAIATDQFNSTVGVFQVYALEGVGRGTEAGHFTGAEADPRLLFDKDMDGTAAGQQFQALVDDAMAEGFQELSFWDQLELEGRSRR